jgi:hypothetical protein
VIKIVAANLTDTITAKEIIDKIIPAHERTRGNEIPPAGYD